MKHLLRHPQLYEINTRVWIDTLSRQAGEWLTLGQIPQETWDHLKDLGMDLVWLMGVWLPSPAGIAVDRHDSAFLRVCQEVLPDFSLEDLQGSPYAVAGYNLNPALGVESDLVQLRDNLHRAGLGLILDFVPNHTAMDHHWVTAHPGRYVAAPAPIFGPGEAFATSTMDGKEYWVAHGHDPYFAPWPDTAQLCSGCPETRVALAAELLHIAKFCDGLRVDMAMLPLNRIFTQTWKAWMEQTGALLPEEEYWPEILEPLKAQYPDFILIAEAYWGLEPELLGQGFDFVYDKTGYDRLRQLDGPAFTQGLQEEGRRRSRMVRFLENHDEDRAAAAFPEEVRRAVAVIHSTAPGLRLFHHGQLEGWRLKLPVQLGRGPVEENDPDFASFYFQLLHLTREPLIKEGVCQLLPVLPPAPGERTHHPIVSLAYSLAAHRSVVVVNFVGQPASGFIQFPADFWQGRDQVRLKDELSEPETVYLRELRQLESQGLYVSLKPYGYHFLTSHLG
ncbi:MAG: alpha-amylase family glycosyl hydrolase [Thermodesulfobacteriota bacterium]